MCENSNTASRSSMKDDNDPPNVVDSSSSLSRSEKPPTMTRSEILRNSSKNNPETLCLIIVNDNVYDCTRWQHLHPGGHLTIRALNGKDATDAFIYTHPKYVRDRMLDKFFYCKLREEDDDDDEDVDKENVDNNISTIKKNKRLRNYHDEATLAFRSLTAKMEQAGMFETNLNFYYKKFAVYMTMFSLVLAGVLCSGDRPWIHALSGILLGLFWQQMAFIGHDLGHNAVTHNREIDSYLGVIVGNLFTGVSMAWWKRSHNVHHIVTNSCDCDPDIQHLPLMAVDPAFVKKPIFSTYANHYLPLNDTTHLFVKYQHWLYYPIMAVARINLYVQSVNHALCLSYYATTKDLVWRREVQIATLLGFWTWLIALTMQLPTWQSQVLFLLPAHVVSGILHVQITLSHFAMPVHHGVTYDDSSNGYLRTQLAGSMDINCPTYMDWFHGGIQFQVVHHLWPRMPRHNLRTAKSMLMAFCQQYGLEYHQETFWQANVKVIGKLHETAQSTKCFSELFQDSLNMNG